MSERLTKFWNDVEAQMVARGAPPHRAAEARRLAQRNAENAVDLGQYGVSVTLNATPYSGAERLAHDFLRWHQEYLQDRTPASPYDDERRAMAQMNRDIDQGVAELEKRNAERAKRGREEAAAMERARSEGRVPSGVHGHPHPALRTPPDEEKKPSFVGGHKISDPDQPYTHSQWGFRVVRGK